MTHPIIEKLREDPTAFAEFLDALVDEAETNTGRILIRLHSTGNKTLLVGVQPEHYEDPNEEVFPIV